MFSFLISYPQMCTYDNIYVLGMDRIASILIWMLVLAAVGTSLRVEVNNIHNGWKVVVEGQASILPNKIQIDMKVTVA